MNTTGMQLDFSLLIAAIESGAKKAKGKLANGVKWKWNADTGVIEFSKRFCSEKINTIVDGVKKGIEWIKEQINKLFNRGEK